MKKGNLFILLLSITCVLVLVGGYLSYQNKIAKEQAMVDSTIISQITEKNNYSDGLFVSVFNGEIKVYVKGSNKKSNNYIGYSITHSEKELNQELESSNYDVWRLSGANEYERTSETNFLKKINVVSNGEWEFATQEEGANDFIGGLLHGDEITTNVKLFIDGKEVDLKSKIEQSVKELKLVTKSDLYRDNTTTEELEKVGIHEKTYVFSQNGLVIDQGVTFEESMKLERTYFAMLPILRNNNGATGSLITDTIKTNYDNKEYDVSKPGFDIEELNRVEASKVAIRGKESGINASVEVLEKSPSDQPTTFHISNSDLYNKLYFTFIEDGYESSEGEQWSQKTLYKIDTVN